MNTTTVIAAILVVGLAGLAMYATTRPKRESFTVLYPSNDKLKRSWDRSAILTSVLADGRLR